MSHGEIHNEVSVYVISICVVAAVLCFGVYELLNYAIDAFAEKLAVVFVFLFGDAWCVILEGLIFLITRRRQLKGGMNVPNFRLKTKLSRQRIVDNVTACCIIYGS